MKIDELINLISVKTNSMISQSTLADALGITRQTVNNRIKNQSEITVSELQRIEDYFKIHIFNTAEHNSDITYIDYYTDVFASCCRS